MPLEKSKSPAAFKRNVRTLMGEVGKSPHVQSRSQALAVAYSIKRRGRAEGGPADDELILPQRNPAAPADWAQNAVRGLAGKVADVVMAPRRAMDQGMTTADATDWAGDVATVAAGAGAPAAVRGAAGIFGGRLAQTADRAALSRAEELAKAGAPREQIWNDTGWFKGGDDKWRFEIPDNQAKLNEQRLMAGKELPLSAHMNHPELYEAYPSLRWADTIRSPDLLSRGVKGSFMGGEGEPLISYADFRGRNAGNAALNKAANAQEKSVLLHEVQHAAQAQEGFARGSNTMFLNPKTPAWDIYQERLKAIRTPTPQAELEKSGILGPNYTYADYLREHKQALRNDTLGLDRMAQDYAVREGYRRAPGEVEARNVQTRMNMTPEERRAKPPWLTEDVPAEQQIFGAQAPGGPQMSAGIPPKEPFRIQPQDIRAPKAANVNTSKAEVLADLPPPLPPSDRIWQNYVKRMGPDEMLKSEPVWSAAENLSAAKGISPSEAFAEVANDMFGRMGANRFMTPAQAKMHMARERGVLVPVPAEGLTMKRPIAGFAVGGSPDFKIHPSYIARAQARSLGHTGPINSMVPGRTDHHAMSVPAKSYVVPADIASGLGQGNTAAGMKVLGAMFPKSGPYGSPAAAMHRGTGMPRPPRADGGAADGGDQDVPIYAAGGEFVVHPDDIADLGGGDHKQGHAAMDAWVKAERAKLIKTLKNLPGPAKD